MRHLLAELRRRNVIRMAGLYLVGAWLITQVAGTVLPMFDAPAWLPRSVVVLLAIGFIPALVMSWLFEMTPDGLKRDAEIAPEESVAPQTARKMERLILILLAIALAFFGFDKLVLAPKREATLVAMTSQTVRAETLATSKAAASEKSIAVLAFENMSADKDNEYFSDGIAEEILNSLSKVKSLRVAGRTSSFSFKGKKEDLRVIGKTLGVSHILEGSVRKQGDKVRITAQLIRSEDGIHLWSETYDGDVKDVFALQEKIARSITDELKVVLSNEQATRLVNAGTENTEAYALFLQASAIFNRRDGDRFPEAVAALQSAIRLDPEYARAHSRLAALYAVLPSYTDANVKEAHAKVIQYAASASALDPRLAEPWAALGFSHGKFPGQLVEQFKNFDHALELDPDDVTTNFWFGLGLIKSGYRERGLTLLDRTLTLDPMLPNALRWRGSMFIYAGELVRAEQLTRRARDLGLLTSDFTLSKIVGAQGDSVGAVRLWTDGTKATMRGFSDENRRLIAEGIYGDVAARQRAVALIDDYLSQPHEHVSQLIPEALFHLQQPARAFEVLRTQQITDISDSFALLWSPKGRSMRMLPEFGSFIHDFGFVQVWDKIGPPDICKKNNKGDYVCE